MEHDDDMDDYMSYKYETDNDDYYDNDDPFELVEDNDDTPTKNDDKNAKNASEELYAILSEDEIRRRQDKEISNLSSVLSISRAESIVLLCHYNWCTSQVHDEWFANESLVRNKVGLLLSSSTAVDDDNNNQTCGICFDDELSSKQIPQTRCRHKYCRPCWKKYIEISVDDTGSGSLRLKCPDPKCVAAVDPDMVTNLAPSKTVKKYMEYLTRSYVELKKWNIKWCPGPGCDNAVEMISCTSNEGVVCSCGHEFCYECEEEPHRPTKCDVVKEWAIKNNSEAENTKWMLAYTKPCPKCKKPIEKNQGCNHMTCRRPCSHQFCWFCGNSLNGGLYHCKCNGYSETRESKSKDKISEREIAKRMIERYAHYYERWASHSKSRDKARSDLAEMKSGKLDLLTSRLGNNEHGQNLEFIVHAWEQIIECRRVLKWTYPYGYFKLENEHVQRQLFEYLQGEAERALERLHFCAETELRVFYEREIDVDEFVAFRAKLVGLTKVTRNFFDNLVKGLENGLSEVQREPKKEDKKAAEVQREPKKEAKEAAISDAAEYWSCDRCTYLNPVGALTCRMCVVDDL